MNKAIEQIKHFNAGLSLTELNQLICAAATVITHELGLKTRKTTNRNRKQPAWKLKLQKDIETKRTEELSTHRRMRKRSPSEGKETQKHRKEVLEKPKPYCGKRNN